MFFVYGIVLFYVLRRLYLTQQSARNVSIVFLLMHVRQIP